MIPSTPLPFADTEGFLAQGLYCLVLQVLMPKGA